MKDECLICKAPLVYLEADEPMECEICHKRENSKTRCVNGHYVCNACHMAGMDAIIGLCLGETSKNPVEILERMMSYGYRPMIAHPERYRYMNKKDYERLRDMGAVLQLNLPSIIGSYGEEVRQKAQMLLDKGFYRMAGSDCHRFRAIRKQYTDIRIKESTLAQLKDLMLA